MKLLIRNLDPHTTKEELNSLFEEFGKVLSCNIVMDEQTKRSKGFGFVVMQKPGDAKAATKNLNNQVVGDSKIRVKKAESKKETPKKEETPKTAGLKFYGAPSSEQ